jgi:hypothetical protein
MMYSSHCKFEYVRSLRQKYFFLLKHKQNFSGEMKGGWAAYSAGMAVKMCEHTLAQLDKTPPLFQSLNHSNYFFFHY